MRTPLPWYRQGEGSQPAVCRTGWERKLSVPSHHADAPAPGPAYVPRTGWPAWAVLPGGVAIAILAALAGVGVATLIAMYLAAQSGAQPTAIETLWISIGGFLGFQIAAVLFTWLAAGMFSSDRAEGLALRTPRGGWKVLPLSLVPLFALTGIWTAALMWLQPDAVIGDLRPFKEMLEAGGIVTLLVLAIGAPLSEELLFRGFLFSGLAKSKLGLVGTGVLTAVLWTGMHAGYSVFGLIEVLTIGLYFSWLLVRTGSTWVTIFCHAVYNTVVGLVLYFVTLPPPA